MKSPPGIGSASKAGISGKGKGSSGGRSETVTTANPGGAARGSAGKAVQATKVARIDSDPATATIGKTAKNGKTGKTIQGPRVSTIADADLKQLIRREAYFRAERRGFAAGFEWQDWFDAEQEVYRLLELDLPRH